MRAVLERDLVAEGSHKRAFVARTFAGAAAAAVVVVAATIAQGDTPTDEIGATSFHFLANLLLAFLAAATPALLVASVLVERRAHTLELLLASPVTVRGIAMGKLLARLGTVLAWAAAALPPLAVLMLFGGISLRHLGNTAAALAGAAVEMAAWGLLISCAARKVATGAVLGYLVPGVHWWLAGNFSRFTKPPLLGALVDATTPFAGMRPPETWTGIAGMGSGWNPGFVYLAFALLLAALVVPVASFLLARDEETGSRVAPRIPHLRGEAGLRRWLTGGNPVAWKESLLLDTAWSRFLYYLLIGLMIVGEITYLLLWPKGNWSRMTNDYYLGGCFGALATLAAVLGASSMSFEKTRGTLDILRASPLSAREIVNGKLGGAAAGFGFLFLLPVLHLVLSCAAGFLHPVTAVLVLGAGALLAANYAVHGVAWGIVAATPFTAILGAVSLTFLGTTGCSLLCLIGPLLVGAALFRKEDSWKKAAELLLLPGILCGSPVMVVTTLSAMVDTLLGQPGRDLGSASRFGLLFIGSGFGVFGILASILFLVNRYRDLPRMMEREMTAMTRGEGPRRAPAAPLRKEWALARWFRSTFGDPKP